MLYIYTSSLNDLLGLLVLSLPMELHSLIFAIHLLGSLVLSVCLTLEISQKWQPLFPFIWQVEWIDPHRCFSLSFRDELYTFFVVKYSMPGWCAADYTTLTRILWFEDPHLPMFGILSFFLILLSSFEKRDWIAFSASNLIPSAVLRLPCSSE